MWVKDASPFLIFTATYLEHKKPAKRDKFNHKVYNGLGLFVYICNKEII